MTKRRHYSVIAGYPKGRTDRERLNLIWDALKRHNLIAERPLSDEEVEALRRDEPVVWWRVAP